MQPWNPDVMLDFTRRLHRESIASIRAMRFDKWDEYQRTLMSLYATLVELTGSFIALESQSEFAGSHTVIRSLLEGHVDLINLLNDPDYLDCMKLAFYEDWLKLLEEGIDKQNPFLVGFQANDKAVEKRRADAEALAALKAKGVKSVHIADRFERAGMTEAYRSVYKRLCMEAHNNIAALNNRHLKPLGKEDFELVIYDHPNELDTLRDTAAGVMINASLGTHRHFKSEASPKFQVLDEELSALRRRRDG